MSHYLVQAPLYFALGVVTAVLILTFYVLVELVREAKKMRKLKETEVNYLMSLDGIKEIVEHKKG
jgi:hypothetical protein